MTAYSALAAAGGSRVDSPEAARNRAFAGLLLDRLEETYIGPDGRVLLSPAIGIDAGPGISALDRYAAEIPYAGLTLLGLEWAADIESRDAEPESFGSALLDSPDPVKTRGFIRTERLWVAVRGGRGVDGDPRSDVGPTAALQKVGGEWQWLIPPRPKEVAGSEVPSSSWLVRRGPQGKALMPTAISTSRDGDRISQEVSFGKSNSAPDVDLKLSFLPAECGGLRYEIDNLAGPLEVTFWMSGPEARDLDGDRRRFRASEVLLSASRQIDVEDGPFGYGSTHPLLRAATFTVPARQGVELDLCRAP